jgi:hypothetical protein
MKTAVSETSREAFHSFSIQDLQRREREVVGVFLRIPGLTLSRERLAWILQWKEGSVCGRVNSLIAKGVLEECGETKNLFTKKKASLVRLVPPPVPVQVALFQ